MNCMDAAIPKGFFIIFLGSTGLPEILGAALERRLWGLPEIRALIAEMLWIEARRFGAGGPVSKC